MTVVVETRALSKKYDHVWALRSLSITIDEGETVAILGPNGAGKSTLLKVLATHLHPSSGAVIMFGQNLLHYSKNARKRVGFVAHDSFLYDELTVQENLEFYGRFFSIGSRAIQELTDVLKLKAWLDAPVKQLSYGLRKRADIARALIHNPDLILLDELFAGLDEETRDFMVGYLKALSGKTLLVSSHSRQWAQRLCRRGLVLENGDLVKDVSF